MAAGDQFAGEHRGDFPASIIARLLNITERRLQQLAREGIVPKSARGKYPLAGTVRGYIKYLQESGGGSSELDPSKLEPFKRRAHWQAESERLELEKKAGELISRLEAEAETTRIFGIIARFLDVLPDHLEREGLITPKAAVRVEGLIDKVRLELHGEIVAESDDGRSAPAPTRA